MDVHRLLLKRTNYEKDLMIVYNNTERNQTLKHCGLSAQLLKTLVLLGAGVKTGTDQIIVVSNGRPEFKLSKVSKSWLATEITLLARRRLMQTLKDRCDWDVQNPSLPPRGRKDMKGRRSKEAGAER